MTKQVQLYTDGACAGNPGAGGYAALLMYGPHRKEVTGGFRYTTNGRMELWAVIAGLQALKEPCQVTVYTDSQYVAQAFNQDWIARWRARDWYKTDGQAVRNQDLWQSLLKLVETHIKVNFEWVKGHADTGNQQVDQLAKQASQQPSLPADTVYEQSAGVVL